MLFSSPFFLFLFSFFVFLASVFAGDNVQERPRKIQRIRASRDPPSIYDSYCGFCRDFIPEVCILVSSVSGTEVHDKCLEKFIMNNKTLTEELVLNLNVRLGLNADKTVVPEIKLSEGAICDFTHWIMEKDNPAYLDRLMQLNLPVESFYRKLKNSGKRISILEAATLKSPKVLKILMENGQFPSKLKNSIIFPAVGAGNREILDYLLDRAGELGTFSVDGILEEDGWETLLRIAIRIDRIDLVKYLLGRGARTDLKDKVTGYPLHQAIQEDKPEIVKVLLEAGAPVDMIEEDCEPALFVAVSAGKISSVKLLLEQPAVYQRKYFSNHGGGNILHAAISSGNIEIVKLLMNRGFDFIMRDGCRSTILHYVILKKNNEMLKFLLESNLADPAEANHPRILREIFETYPGLEGHLSVEDPPAVTAIIYGNVSALKLLLQHNFNPNSLILSNSRTLLHFACELQRIESVKVLISQGADTNAINFAGRTPLSYLKDKTKLKELSSLDLYL